MRTSPYERMIRVDTVDAVDGVIDVKAYIHNMTPFFQPTGFILDKVEQEDPENGYSVIDHSAKSNPDSQHEAVPLACYVVHPGEISKIWTATTTASKVFVVGIQP